MENSQSSNMPNVGIQVNSPSKIPLEHLKMVQNAKSNQSYMPFIFRNKKNTISNIPHNPAPGHYQTKSNFQHKNDRDVLKNEYNVILANSKKIKESVIFKSTAKRFNYKDEPDYNNISSYSYDQFGIKKNKPHKRNNQKYRTITKINQHKIYPSIPDKSIKYGYRSQTQGKLHKINKTNQQLLKQKLQMKDYIKRFKIQDKYKSYRSSTTVHKSKNSFIQQIQSKIRNISQYTSNTDQKIKNCQQNKDIKKPVKQNNIKCNQAKVKNIFMERKYLENNLGPGCYISHGDIATLYCSERYQFFNSSSQRFPNQFNSIQDKCVDVKSIVRKIDIQNKLLEARKSRAQKYRQGIKMLEREPYVCEREGEPPGPGQYDPKQSFIKTNLTKSGVFPKSLRFEEKKSIYQKDSLGQSLSGWRYNENKQNQLISYQQKSNRKNYTKVMHKNNEIVKKMRQCVQQSRPTNRSNESLNLNGHQIGINNWKNGQKTPCV